LWNCVIIDDSIGILYCSMSGAIVKSIQLRREKAKKEKESQPKKIGQEEGFVPEISVLEADRAAAALASVYSQQDHQPKKNCCLLS